MGFFQQRPSDMAYLQIVKEHVLMRRFIAYINVKVAVFVNRQVGSGHRLKHFTTLNLNRIGRRRHELKLLVKEQDIQIRLG